MVLGHLKPIFMFYSITWMQFGIAICSAGLLYYLIILFRYYRQEISAFLSGYKGSAEPAVPLFSPAPLQPVFGTIKVNESEMNLVGADELDFAETEPDEI
jgi:hypothetical protein